jgi:hypothetical protein
LVWWTPGTRFAGARARLVTDILQKGEGEGTRLVIRMSADADGVTAHAALWIFRFIDSIMARRQLLEIKKRVERYDAHSTNPVDPETGRRDQYQLYEIIYASGEAAGIHGKEDAPRWREAAIRDGVLAAPTGARQSEWHRTS